MVLAVTATGVLLPPTLILKRKTRHVLAVRNRIGMKVFGTENGWMKSEVMIDWLEEVFKPYVGSHKALLVFDSYAHYSQEVRQYLSRYPNIHIAIIPGGLTPVLQPLDYSINAIYKRSIKEASQKHQTEGARLNVEQREKKKIVQQGPENTILTKPHVIISKFDEDR